MNLKIMQNEILQRMNLISSDRKQISIASGLRGMVALVLPRKQHPGGEGNFLG